MADVHDADTRSYNMSCVKSCLLYTSRLFCVVILVVGLAVGPGCERQDAGGCH